MLEDRRKVISDSIRVVPHFPKEGIMFQDITTLLLNPTAFQYSIEDFVEHYRDQKVEAIAGTTSPLIIKAGCPEHRCLFAIGDTARKQSYTAGINSDTAALCRL